jgi:hypothetical protein
LSFSCEATVHLSAEDVTMEIRQVLAPTDV